MSIFILHFLSVFYQKKAEKEKEDAQKASIGGTADLDKLKTELKTVNQTLAKEREANRAHQVSHFVLSPDSTL